MRNIFVFEKEKIVCLDIKTIFSSNGFNVVCGSSVMEFVNKGVKPALVILDVLSYNLMQKESNDVFGANGKSVPLILSTSGNDYVLNGNASNNTKLNVIGKVTKPYDTHQLMDIYNAYQLQTPDLLPI